ncbi:hypothetical protein [Spongiactinospora rosea]|nr:hypothetical protein [Spongiactinospora rosea]
MPTTTPAAYVALWCVVVLGGCAPAGAGEYLVIANGTGETVSVRGRLQARPFAVLGPGEGTSISFPGWMCEEHAPGNSLVATVGDGRTYTYGPPLCNGRAWEIAS